MTVFSLSSATAYGVTSFAIAWEEEASVTTWIAALVVEDEALMRFDLAQSLEAEGYKTFEAADAAEAIAVMEAHPEIRVVFTDIQMPGTMDGLALSHYVRKR